MSVQTQNTNLNPYSNTPIKNLEYIQNKALVIVPFEITKSGLIDTDLMLDTPGTITMYLYKKIVAGEDKEPTADQFKTIKTMSDLDSIGINSEALITTFDIPVIFKYNKDTGTRTIEKGTSGIQLPPDYIDFTIDETNASFSLEGFFCVCKVQKIQKELTTPFSDVANDEFLFMIPSEECRELIEPAEFDSSSLDNKVINIKKYGIPLSNDTKQGYRIYPILKINDHITLEDTFSPKYYLGTKYQRNLMEILSQGIKSKRTIFNLKDMYLVDDLCIQTLKKINILLENDQMIKFSERLYQNGIREKINADLILEYLSIPVSGSSNNDINSILKISLIEDYNFTQDEIDNLNDNLNTFKSRARIALSTPVIQGQGLDQLRFNLPKTFIDSNRSQTEKKNLLVFGTDAGFNKFNLAGYTVPYSNVTKRDVTSALVYSDLVANTPVVSDSSNTLIDSYTKLFISGSITDLIGNTISNTGNVVLSKTTVKNNINSLELNSGSKWLAIQNTSSQFSFGLNEFTIEFNLNTVVNGDIPIMTFGLNGTTIVMGIYVGSTGAINVGYGGGGWGWISDWVGTAANVIKSNIWTNIVIQRRSGNIEIYIDGVKKFTRSWAINLAVPQYCFISSYFGVAAPSIGYIDDIRISNGIARYTTDFTVKPLRIMNVSFKDFLTNYKQQIPFTYIPMSTDIANTNNEPVFENLTDITGFDNSDIIIDIPNVL